MVQSTHNHMKAYKIQFEKNSGITIKVDSPLLTWSLRPAIWQRTRFHKRQDFRVALFCVACTGMASAVDMMIVDSAPSATRRRREGRVRQFLRHERLTVAMVLSEKKRHTSRGQTKDRTEWGTRSSTQPSSGRTQLPGARHAGTATSTTMTACRSLGGSRPDRLIPASGPQDKIQRHKPPSRSSRPSLAVPILDDPVPLMVDQLVDIIKIIDMSSFVEQVIDVPKIIQDSIPQRRVLSEPQHLVELLVDVPPPLLTRRLDVSELLACHWDAANQTWFACVGTRGVHRWQRGTRHTLPWEPPPSGQGGI